MAKILVIDDEQDIRLNIIKALQYEGFEAIGAENGRTGVTLAQMHLPDVVICDILMPQLRGYGVLIELRSDPRTAHIPFIFLSAKKGAEDRRKGIQLGADVYLTKPFALDELVSQVMLLLLKKDTAASKQLGMVRFNLARTLPVGLQSALTAILGFSGLLVEMGFEELPEPSEIVAIQTHIYENALRLQRRIGNYLLYQELQLAQYDLTRRTKWRQRTLLKSQELISAVAISKAEEFNRRQDLALELIDDEGEMPAESLQKIVEELLDNALTFSDPGTVVRIITAIEQRHFTLKIVDRGYWVTAELLMNHSAERLGDRQPDKFQETGLGLKIVHLLVQMHGGTLTIQNEQACGATVTVTLP